jgi:hypothetical protein
MLNMALGSKSEFENNLSNLIDRQMIFQLLQVLGERRAMLPVKLPWV